MPQKSFIRRIRSVDVMGLIEEISEFLQKGRSKKVKELVQKALA